MFNIKSQLIEFRPLLLDFYLASMAYIGVVSLQAYLNTGFHPEPALFLMGIVFAIYGLNRFTDMR